MRRRFAGERIEEPNTKVHILDNPIWSSLTTRQTYLAEGDGLARRYPVDVTALAALKEPSAEAFDSLARISKSDAVALFCYQPITIPAGWKTIHTSNLAQMVCVDPRVAPVPAEITVDKLGAADSDEMVALTKLTNPGPFGSRTHELGLYLGIHQQGRLAAMAGERQKLPGYTEVSAVCTHPDYVGKGYARVLMLEVMRGIRERGEIPMLHVRQNNARAVELYERLGFRSRVVLHLAVLKKS